MVSPPWRAASMSFPMLCGAVFRLLPASSPVTQTLPGEETCFFYPVDLAQFHVLPELQTSDVGHRYHMGP